MTAELENSTGARVDPLPVVEFALKRPPFWSLRFTVVFVLLVASGIGYYVAVLPAMLALPAMRSQLVLELLVPLSACLVAISMRLWLRPRRVPPIAFFDDHLRAPRHAESRRALHVAYEDILSVDLRGRGRSEHLLIGTRRRLFMYPRPVFVSPDAVEQALKELYLRILRLPHGTKVVEQIARRRKLAVAAMSQAATATNVILAAMGLLFALEFLTGALARPFGHVRFGAAAPVLVRDGEVYRLLASTLLHANVMHLYLNALAFFFLGAILERILGRTRFLLIYLVAGLAGALASVAADTRLLSVNASAGTFGLIATYVAVNVRFGADLPVGFRQPLRWWTLMAAFNGVLPLFVPEIDPWALAAGFAAGALVSFLVVDGREGIDPTVAARVGLRFTAGVLSMLFVGAYVAALGGAWGPQADPELSFARRATEDRTTSASSLGTLAWKLARHAPANEAELEVARRAAARAAAMHPSAPELLDIVAAVHYRRGDLDAAIETGRSVLRARPQGYYAEHLARYLHARLRRQGPALVGGVPPETVRVEVLEDGSAVATPVAKLAVSRDFPHGLTVYALALRGEDLVGLLRIRVSPAPMGEHRLDDLGSFLWPPSAAITPALVEDACRDCSGRFRKLDLWNLEAQVRDLP